MSCGCEDNSSEASTMAGRLNAGCFCRTLDEAALSAALRETLGDLAAPILEARPHLFSHTPVFLSAGEVVELRAVVAAIEEVVRNPSYQRAALAWAPEIARRDLGPRGAFMGYDFHLTAEGPRLIEVNTNAGGAFLNALAGQAQRVCCGDAGIGLAPGEAGAFATAAREMFAREWSLQGRTGPLGRIAIVDDSPGEQHLYPEFLIAQRMLAVGAVEVLVLDPTDLAHRDGVLSAAGAPIDLVYNRLVDFAFEEPRHAALRSAYLDGAVVVTPNPHLHALYADKRDLILFSDLTTLAAWGVSDPALHALKAVPRTIRVTPDNADELWRERKRWFFKPTRGHASKGVYRGEKLTTRVWAEILAADYVAQAYSPPSERQIAIDGRPETRKLDVRLYTYDGDVLLSAARLYQGQATNFRTPGGGFAPLFVV
ncbi:ATP-grasp domain-containing protein [Phenylobacterium soli]|uniref:Circularly permuted type 2 ATP-grasp protein n=1 Tax=Phenylobacterium soli TaxID=2170551 RepID=A0A328AHU0_9CAUL|nr:hypothetical protein [Phenylobacterium soli]RAK54111.1 hypothetical protein DJ017_06035 [Phenylobacterium soli]